MEPIESEPKKSLVTWTIIAIILLAVFGVYELINKNETPPTSNIDDNQTATTTFKDDAPANWLTYTNNSYAYRFRYPTSVIFSKDLSVPNDDGTDAVVYKAGDDVPVRIQDLSATLDSPNRSRVTMIPLYVEINVYKKPAGYKGLKSYVDTVVADAIKQGENSVAGVYATASPTIQNEVKGYLVVISDGSVVKNRDDKYYFDHGDYIYAFDMAYSGYYYETKDSDETMRVETAKKVFSTFRFTK